MQYSAFCNFQTQTNKLFFCNDLFNLVTIFPLDGRPEDWKCDYYVPEGWNSDFCKI